MSELKINYGINRKEKKGVIHRQGTMKIEGDWENGETHKMIRAKIISDHPGWNITGYCLVREIENPFI